MNVKKYGVVEMMTNFPVIGEGRKQLPVKNSLPFSSEIKAARGRQLLYHWNTLNRNMSLEPLSVSVGPLTFCAAL
jgi:hypothetical protein